MAGTSDRPLLKKSTSPFAVVYSRYIQQTQKQERAKMSECSGDFSRDRIRYSRLGYHSEAAILCCVVHPDWISSLVSAHDDLRAFTRPLILASLNADPCHS